ncbi:hypothetical protein AHAS_Ahas03G0210700 [Arachis hypogaea]
MDPMNLDSKSDLLRPITVVAISLLLCHIISMATLSTTLIASFKFFSELMFSNHFNFHMSEDSEITRCTDSLDSSLKLTASLDFGRKGMNHYSGERHALGIVVELGLEDVVDLVEIGGDAFIENMEVDDSGTTRVTVTPWLEFGAEEEERKNREEDCEGEEGEYEC